MYKNLIFDFGQVIVHFEPEYMTKQYISEKEDIKLVSKVVFDRLYWDRLDEGSITDEEVVSGICKRLPQRLHETAIKVYENWYYNLPLIEGIYELLKDIKAEGYGLYLLSNISIGFAENFDKLPVIGELLNFFDGLVFSGPLGLVKPKCEIFEYITSKYSLSKSETLFIDDNVSNISGAEAFGINGYLFDGDTNKLREFLGLSKA